MQAKTTIRYHVILVRKVIINKTIVNVREVVGKKMNLHTMLVGM